MSGPTKVTIMWEFIGTKWDERRKGDGEGYIAILACECVYYYCVLGTQD